MPAGDCAIGAPQPRHAATHTHYSFFFKYNTAGGVTQPLYTAPCADLRAKRIVHDGTSVRWTLPALAGGIVRIPSTPLLDLHIAPNSTAWRMGGANDTYLALPRRDSTAHRADQRKKAGQKAPLDVASQKLEQRKD